MSGLPIIIRDKELAPYDVPGEYAAFASRRCAGFIRAVNNGPVRDAERRVEIAIMSAYLQGLTDAALVLDRI